MLLIFGVMHAMDHEEPQGSSYQEEKTSEFNNPLYGLKWVRGCHEQKLREKLDADSFQQMLACPRIMRDSGYGKLKDCIERHDTKRVAQLLVAGCDPDGSRSLFEDKKLQIYLDGVEMKEPEQAPVPSPLFLACQKGAVHCARLLLKHGADPDGPGLFKRTPLHAVCTHPLSFLESSRELVMLLLAFGATIEARDISEQTAVDCADGNPDFLQFLRASIEEAKKVPFDVLTHRAQKKKEREAIIRELIEKWQKDSHSSFGCSSSGGGMRALLM